MSVTPHSLDDDEELENVWAAALEKAQKKMAQSREGGSSQETADSDSGSDASSDGGDSSGSASVGVSDEEVGPPAGVVA